MSISPGSSTNISLAEQTAVKSNACWAPSGEGGHRRRFSQAGRLHTIGQSRSNYSKSDGRRAALEELRRLNVPSEEDPLNVSATTSSADYRQATGKGFCNPSRAACRTRPSGSWTISEVLRNIFGMRSKPRHIGELARRQIQDWVDGKAHFLRRSHGRT